MVTGEQTSNGDDFTITAGFRVYHNYTECINDRAVLLTDVYSDLIAGVTDAKEFAQQMGSRWATDIRYAEKLKFPVLLQGQKLFDRHISLL